MTVQRHKLFSAPGSAEIPFSMSYTTESYSIERGNGGSLLIDKISELLHKEFGEMPLSLSITPRDIDRYYELRVRYGVDESHYICTNINRQSFIDAQDDCWLQIIAEVTADKLIWYIREDIMDTMFGFEIKDKTPEKVSAQGEKAFRKILI